MEIKFRDTQCLTITVAIYVDFKTINQAIHDGGFLKTEQKVISARFYAECNKSQCMEWSYVGDGGVVRKFLDELYYIYPKSKRYSGENRKMMLGKVSKEIFDETFNCKGYGIEFVDGVKKCSHHDHGAEIFKGAYSNSCNHKMRLDNLPISVLFHYAKGYDFHPIIKELNEAQCSNFEVIPIN